MLQGVQRIVYQLLKDDRDGQEEDLRSHKDWIDSPMGSYQAHGAVSSGLERTRKAASVYVGVSKKLGPEPALAQPGKRHVTARKMRSGRRMAAALQRLQR